MFHRIHLAFLAIATAAAGQPVQFNRDVRPILSENCFVCHGPDKNHRKADLRLDIRESAIKEKAFVPGKPEKSALVDRLFTKDEDDLMPPPDSHKVLTAQQKDILKRWIAEGAEYQPHWAYIAPVKAAISGPSTNPVDALVGARLARLGLKPSPTADPVTLIRRLSFDVIGLPPTIEEVDAFVADCAKEPSLAYARLVERLLASPHYGERMAIGWLDVVRYADTIGYHSDTPRNVYPYRDWVIKSFNDNKRFDRFSVEQLAGDLLPDATQDTKVASAFNRLILSTEEGGAQAKDYEQRMLADRVRAVGTVWLAQTLGCCQCHDHKFDPASQRDFYSMGAFFADIKEGIIGRREDGMLVVTPEQEARLKSLDSALAAAQKNLKAVQPKIDQAQKEWEERLTNDKSLLTALEKDPKADKIAAAALKKETKVRNPKEKTAIASYFADKVTPLFKSERDAVAKAQQARDAFYNPLPKCLVSISDANKRTVRILPRGNWMDESGPLVKASLPAFLPGPKKGESDLTRLDLAKWIVARDNPLTARVFVNRLWKQFFGTGLSKVLDDLGMQGEPPPNQELLDWLACEFMDSGWDVKHMVGLIVSSKTYQQTSLASKELQNRDPYNRELARQSRFRMDAELVRDNALSIAGLLNPQIGGPSVRPYQPEGYWENLNFPPRIWQADMNAEQYRRGLYTWWQRSFLHPSMVAFDAPSREECCAERNRSNIPQQALVLLNDPTYVEAARAFAARIVRQGGPDPQARLTWAWKQAVSRAPRPNELKTARALYDRHLAEFQADPAAAAEFMKNGQSPPPDGLDKADLAAWTDIARLVLNLHETITRQ